MKGFYADLKRGAKFALLAGPFRDEATARKYERAAYRAANEVDPWAAFDAYGVVSIESEEPLPLGKLNDRLNIEPGDLMDLEEQ